jgi:hypothetical protein
MWLTVVAAVGCWDISKPGPTMASRLLLPDDDTTGFIVSPGVSLLDLPTPGPTPPPPRAALKRGLAADPLPDVLTPKRLCFPASTDSTNDELSQILALIDVVMKHCVTVVFCSVVLSLPFSLLVAARACCEKKCVLNMASNERVAALRCSLVTCLESNVVVSLLLQTWPVVHVDCVLHVATGYC